MRPTPMPSAPIERLSIRAAVALGLAVILGLWLFTGYTFARRMDEVERRASDVAARYTRAQEMLATVRALVLVNSVRVRDALLNPDPSALATYRTQVETNYATIQDALSQYEPVLETDAEMAQVARLRHEIDNFQATTRSVLEGDAPGQTTAEVRELLNAHIVPRREAAVRISEEIQALNRAAFLKQQADLAAIHRTAEEQSARRLGAAMAVSMAVLLLAWVYAGRLERQLRRQMEVDARISRDLQDATSKLMSAQEDERKTIARELHDEVGQVLTAIKVELGLAQRTLESKGLPGAPLAEAQLITDGAINTVRDITQLLHPSALDDLGLPAAVEASLRGLQRRHDIKVEFTQEGMDERLEPETELAAYRIVQEALTNVARHSRATFCGVRLARNDHGLVVEIQDDGHGFEVDPVETPARRGIGLIGIRERTSQLGGSCQIESQPGAGTRITAELPVEAVSV